ncbi:MAG: hypothetical protein R2845_15500 [Thermomicrobiales bacterium]
MSAWPVLTVDAGGTISAAGVAVTGATSKATRLTSVESALVGQPATADVIAAAAANAVTDSKSTATSIRVCRVPGAPGQRARKRALTKAAGI